MKKILLTCFLALPCLFGSTSLLSLVAQSPGADLLHRFGGPNRGGPFSRPDTFAQLANSAETSVEAIYTTDVSAIDGGPALRSAVSHLPASIKETASLRAFARSDDPLHWESVLSTVKASDIRHRTSDIKLNFGLVDSDQDLRVGFKASILKSPSVPVFSSQIKQELARQAPESQSLVSSVLSLESNMDSLRIGDLIPDDLHFTRVLQSDAKAIRLSDYRGKYLILQFWATWCTASSGYLLQAEEIQEHFGDRIQVLPVTYESKEQVEKSLGLRKSLGDLQLPLITEEARLRNYFPHITLPHLILIDPEGKVRAITGAEDMTIPNLQALMDGGENRFRFKQDTRIPFDMEEKLISGNHQIKSKNIQFQSALTHYIPGVSGGSMESLSDGTHLLFVNTSLIKLYRHAYSGRDLPNYFGSNRILTEGFEEEELTTAKSGLDYREWMEKGDRVFGYELITPPGVDGYALMQEDLKRFFPHIEAKVEVRPRMVWALIQQDGRAYPPSNSDKSYQVNPGSARLRNSLLTGFIYQLNLYFMQRSPYPVMDRTGIDYPIDIDLEANFSKPEELKAALNKTGLDLVLREENIPVLILTKVKPQTQINP